MGKVLKDYSQMPLGAMTRNGQVGFEADASWHAPVLQQHAATQY